MKVRWGILSTAKINQALMPAIRSSKRGELVAVASRSLEKAQTYAKTWKIPKAFGSYQEMLDSGKIDAVYISLPNHLHAEWSINALQAGVHVLCEKPIATSLQEVDAMVSAQKESGMVLAEAFMYHHHPQTKIVKQWVQSGKLGQILFVRGTFDYSLSIQNRAPETLNIRLVPEWGGGCLWDVGVYPISFAQFVTGGPPELVMGTQWVGKYGVDETFAGQLKYHGGCMAQISCSFRSPLHSFIEIIGSQGRFYLNQPFAQTSRTRKLIFFPPKGRAKQIRVPQKELYLGEVQDMHAAILDSQPNFLPLDESRNHVRTVLGLYESAHTGKFISLK
jgi:D-xylose 1-dehydrogenase (NADP+, D-xylono-1,5-lactone-forming)